MFYCVYKTRLDESRLLFLAKLYNIIIYTTTLIIYTLYIVQYKIKFYVIFFVQKILILFHFTDMRIGYNNIMMVYGSYVVCIVTIGVMLI